MRAFAAAVLVVVLAVPPVPAAAAKKPASVQKIARSLVRAGVPGAIVFVRTPKGVHSAVAGAAQLQPYAPMRVTDHYRIASLTKTFVAAVVLQLAAEGKLGLDDSIEHWLPGVVPNGTQITLRELLNHTSGLFNYTDDLTWQNTELGDPGHVWSPSDLLALSFSHEALFAPGTNYHYSNTGYVLLGLVVEKITGAPIGEVLRTRIFEPLGLRETSFPAGIEMPEPLVHGYVDFQGVGLLDITALMNPSWLYAAGQIVSTAADVTTFFSALLKGRVVPAPLLAQMKRGSDSSATYGLGLMLRSSPCGRSFGHDGDSIGWRNVVSSNATGSRVAVVIVNLDRGVSWAKLNGASAAALCSG
jgi:D-alanyl-D-alanine carboxypeptidase